MKLDCKETKILLNAYIDLELSNEEIELVETHIKECAHCKQDLDALLIISQSIKEMPGAPVRPELAHQLKIRVAQESYKFFRKVSPGDLLTFTFLRQIGLVFMLILLAIYISLEVFINNPINQKKQNVITVVFGPDNSNDNNTIQKNNNKSSIPTQIGNNNELEMKQAGPIKTNNQAYFQNKSNKSKPSPAATNFSQLQPPGATKDGTPSLDQDKTAPQPLEDSHKIAERFTPESNKSFENPDGLKSGSSAEPVTNQPESDLANKSANTQNPENAKHNELDPDLLKLLKDTQIADDLKDSADYHPKLAKDTITIPIKFSDNLEKPILIIARLKFNGEKALTNIEFLSKMKDVKMRISLIRGLQNYDWKEFLIRNNLTGTTYKMDFILAKDGIILKNMPEKIIYKWEKPLGLNS